MTDGPPAATRQLPASNLAPRLARDFVAEALGRWECHHVVERARLLVSEVVTNAVMHAQSTSTLRVELSNQRIHVSLVDLGDGLATVRDTHSSEPGGYGLVILSRLAERWGARRLDRGHEVWFDLSTGADSP